MSLKTPSARLFLLLFLVLGALGWVMLAARSFEHDTVEEADLSEASGLAASQRTPGLLYTHNDSGNPAIVYVLNKRGLMPARIALEGVKNRDWEDIAVGRDPASGRSCVFVGDIGDNAAAYSSVFIYRFAEPEIADTLITVSDVDTMEFVYEDGPRDAEALFCDPRNGDIYVISKREAYPGIYLLSYPQSYSSVNTAYRVASLPYNWVTAADISPDGRSILVKTYSSVYKYKRGANMSIGAALSRKYKSLPYELEPQGEAIAWDNKGKGYFTLSERLGATPSELYYYK